MYRRRALEGVAAALSLGATTGCLGRLGSASPATRPEPVDLSGGKQDDHGGMVIGMHGGPNGQIFYAENEPEGHDNPAWFHTLAYGLFPYYFLHRRRGWDAQAVYVTDYSSVDFDLTEGEGGTHISSPTSPESFGDAREATYVMESGVLGGMGADFLPFSEEGDAESFVASHGGRTVGFDQITPELLESYA